MSTRYTLDRAAADAARAAGAVVRLVDGHGDDGAELPGWSITTPAAETWTVRWYPLPWDAARRRYIRGVCVIVAAGVSKSEADAAMMRHPNRVECESTPDR